MLKNTIYLLCAFALIFLLSNFQSCDRRECETFFVLQNWTNEILDNSGASTRVSNSPVPRLAAGFRISAMRTSDGVTPVTQETIETCYIIPINLISNIEIHTEMPFDTVPAGADISNRFGVQIGEVPNARYYDFLSGINLNYNDETPDRAACTFDLLLLQPPDTPGEYRFSMHIRFDTTGTNSAGDTAFSLLPLVLQ